jgi:hypothetical protein
MYTLNLHQQLRGYRVEEKIYLGVRERKRLNVTGLEYNCYLVTVVGRCVTMSRRLIDPTGFCPHSSVVLCGDRTQVDL